MARMRFRSKPLPRSLHAHISTDDRQPEHVGDMPLAAPEPPKLRWSISTYPYADPMLSEEADSDG